MHPLINHELNSVKVSSDCGAGPTILFWMHLIARFGSTLLLTGILHSVIGTTCEYFAKIES